MNGEGISWTGDLLDTGVEEGIIQKSGSWYSYDGERIGQGRNNAKEFFKDNPDISRAVLVKLNEALGICEKDKESP